MSHKAAMVAKGREIRLFNEISANRGNFYVLDCQPWAIKEGCKRLDCPMRKLALVEAKPEDRLIKCEPAGDLANLLIKLQRTQTQPT